jgi:hypothetical protein
MLACIAKKTQESKKSQESNIKRRGERRAVDENAIIRRKGAQSLAALVGSALDPISKTRGFAGNLVMAQWQAIIGTRLADHTRPMALRWPVRHDHDDPDNKRRGATLEIAVTGAFALEVQHSQTQILERINAALGWRAVEKIKLLQQPIQRNRPAAPPPQACLTPEEDRDLSNRLQKFEDPDMRSALHRLGVGVISRSRHKR